MDKVLPGRFLQHFVLEWPLRWLAPFESRAFATRLSNRDLTALAAGLPGAVIQFWLSRLPLSVRRSSEPGA
jgi:hypothetical protein